MKNEIDTPKPRPTSRSQAMPLPSPPSRRRSPAPVLAALGLGAASTIGLLALLAAPGLSGLLAASLQALGVSLALGLLLFGVWLGKGRAADWQGALAFPRNLSGLRICFGRWLLVLAVLAGLFLPALPARADPYPPYWEGGSGSAVHYPPVDWATEPADPQDCQSFGTCGEWEPYTRFGATINDPRTQDPSNGGTRPQNYVNIASGCVDQSLPSIYYAYTSTITDTLLFRWRVEQIANTYGTGPSAGSYANTAPWNSALWTVFFDLDGDGYRDLAAHLDGQSGLPATPVDRLFGIWGNIPTQSIDYTTDPNIHVLAHNPTGFVDQATDKILNFHDTRSPDTNWPNGAAETTWDYGTTRSRLITKKSPCTEYFIDYQIPLSMLDASSLGGPRITGDTPISLLFCTANSLNNPFQKDCIYQGDWIADPNQPAPFGDIFTINGGLIQQPIVDGVTASGCGSTTLTAYVKEAVTTVGGVAQTTVKTVAFYYFDNGTLGTHIYWGFRSAYPYMWGYGNSFPLGTAAAIYGNYPYAPICGGC